MFFAVGRHFRRWDEGRAIDPLDSYPGALCHGSAGRRRTRAHGSPGCGGKKLAQRIILELKDKLKGKLKDRETTEAFLPDTALPGGNALDEARMALQVLGYSSSEASAALRGCDPAVLNVEEMIRAALKQLAR